MCANPTMARCIKFYMNCTTLKEEPSTHDVTTVTMETRQKAKREERCVNRSKRKLRAVKNPVELRQRKTK